MLGGVRVYFGQRDKTLIDRHRQDDPEEDNLVEGHVGNVNVGAGKVVASVPLDVEKGDATVLVLSR